MKGVLGGRSYTNVDIHKCRDTQMTFRLDIEFSYRLFD